eukprot:m.197753 g.197753  ORF g.197753 m.197753 type:complete len:70 (+) comp32666_c0_seq5:3327-3536(+)
MTALHLGTDISFNATKGVNKRQILFAKGDTAAKLSIWKCCGQHTTTTQRPAENGGRVKLKMKLWFTSGG